MQDIISKFTDHLKSVLARALTFVVEQHHETVDPIHILWALSSQQGSLAADVLSKSGADAESIFIACTSMKQQKKEALPTLSNDAKVMIEKAVAVANLYEHRFIGTEHLLYALLQMKSDEVMSYFSDFDIDIAFLDESLQTTFKVSSDFPFSVPQIGDGILTTSPAQKDEKTPAYPALDYFTDELTHHEYSKNIDTVFGREKEISRMMTILGRRSKNNPILIGHPGVGKTAIVEGLAKRIADCDVPVHLKGMKLHSLSLSAVLAGTMYRGEFESRLRQLIEEIEECGNIILFIDEVHTIMGAGSAGGSLDAANILKPALARGTIRCIGATTLSEYKKHIEKDNAIERRFQSIRVHEPDEEKTLQILRGIIPYYEEHHNVRYSDQAILSTVKGASKYMLDRHFPDKAIDILDEAGSTFRPKKTKTLANKEKLHKELRDIKKKKESFARDEQYDKAKECKKREDEIKRALKKLKKESKAKQTVIDEKEILHVIEQMTGMNVQPKSKSKQLSKLRRTLKKDIIGQDHIIDQVSRSLVRSVIGLGKHRGPLASFFFAGPSGSGKTSLAEKIAEHLFKNTPILRLDMGEYASSFTVSSLFGAPAGYVGYRESAKLTDHLKQHPHSLILFDEIEKAHPHVQHALLQILDSGVATDSTGRTINAKNAVFVFTSNTGSRIANSDGLGFTKNSDKDEAFEKELRSHFSAEFLGRMNYLGLFKPLTDHHVKRIIKKQISELANRLMNLGLDFSAGSNVPQKLAKDIRKQYGARDISRMIENKIEIPIAEQLLSCKNARTVHADIQDGDIVIRVTG